MEGYEYNYQRQMHLTRLQMYPTFLVNRNPKSSKELRLTDILNLPMLDKDEVVVENIDEVLQAKELIKERWRA